MEIRVCVDSWTWTPHNVSLTQTNSEKFSLLTKGKIDILLTCCLNNFSWRCFCCNVFFSCFLIATCAFCNACVLRSSFISSLRFSLPLNICKRDWFILYQLSLAQKNKTNQEKKLKTKQKQYSADTYTIGCDPNYIMNINYRMVPYLSIFLSGNFDLNFL